MSAISRQPPQHMPVGEKTTTPSPTPPTQAQVIASIGLLMATGGGALAYFEGLVIGSLIWGIGILLQLAAGFSRFLGSGPPPTAT